MTSAANAPTVLSGTRASRWTRYVGYGAAWVLFITVGRLIVPQASSAAESPAPAPVTWTAPAAPATPLRVEGAGRLLGELEGVEYIVRLVSTPEGTRYTVCLRDGTVVREGLDAYELGETFPELDVTTKRADTDE